MMKIPGNNSNGTEEMWEIPACPGETWAGCDFNSAPSTRNISEMLLRPSRLVHVSNLFFPCFGELYLRPCSGFTGHNKRLAVSVCSHKSSRGQRLPESALRQRRCDLSLRGGGDGGGIAGGIGSVVPAVMKMEGIYIAK